MLAWGIAGTMTAAACPEPAKPEVICAWCDKEQGVTRLLASGVSHGICPRHERMMLEEIGAVVPSLGAQTIIVLDDFCRERGAAAKEVWASRQQRPTIFHRGVETTRWWSRWSWLVPPSLARLSFLAGPGVAITRRIVKRPPERGDRLGRLLSINGGVK